MWCIPLDLLLSNLPCSQLTDSEKLEPLPLYAPGRLQIQENALKGLPSNSFERLFKEHEARHRVQRMVMMHGCHDSNRIFRTENFGAPLTSGPWYCCFLENHPRLRLESWKRAFVPPAGNLRTVSEKKLRWQTWWCANKNAANAGYSTSELLASCTQPSAECFLLHTVHTSCWLPAPRRLQRRVLLRTVHPNCSVGFLCQDILKDAFYYVQYTWVVGFLRQDVFKDTFFYVQYNRDVSFLRQDVFKDAFLY